MTIALPKPGVTEIVLNLQDIKRDYLTAVQKQEIPAAWQDAGEDLTYHPHVSHLTNGNLDDGNKWRGSSKRQMCDYIENGYRPEGGLKVKAKSIAKTERKRRRYSDQNGTLDVNRALSGEQNFYVEKVKRPIAPGITVNFRFDFNGGVTGECVSEYALWVARLCAAIESKGIDIELNCDNFGNRVVKGQNTTRILINVKKRGTRSRFHSWSCLVAPGAFRELVFTSFYTAAATHGTVANPSLGSATESDEWSVKYDKKANTVTVWCDANYRGDFPEESMTDQAKAQGLL